MSTFLVTGASGSMGFEATKSLAAQGNHVIMACRNLDKGEKTRQSILQQFPNAQLTLLKLDLSQLESVRCATLEVAKILQNDNVLLDGIFNNAGIINRDFRLTQDGYENTLQVNFIGPALLTLSLMPYTKDNAHIVNMVSLTCRFGKIDERLFEKTKKDFSQLGTYSDTKLALLLFSIALYRHRESLGKPDIYINVADPGVVNSNMISMGRWFDRLADILFRPLCSSPAKGVVPALRALSTSDNCAYFVGKKQPPINRRYLNDIHIEWIWSEIQKML